MLDQMGEPNRKRRKFIMKPFLMTWTCEYTKECGVSRFKKSNNREDGVETFVNDFDSGVLIKIITTTGLKK